MLSLSLSQIIIIHRIILNISREKKSKIISTTKRDGYREYEHDNVKAHIQSFPLIPSSEHHKKKTPFSNENGVLV